MMGSRLDLQVFEEPEATSRTRWNARRLAYIATLLDQAALSSETRAGLEAERAKIQG